MVTGVKRNCLSVNCSTGEAFNTLLASRPGLKGLACNGVDVFSSAEFRFLVKQNSNIQIDFINMTNEHSWLFLHMTNKIFFFEGLEKAVKKNSLDNSFYFTNSFSPHQQHFYSKSVIKTQNPAQRFLHFFFNYFILITLSSTF